MKSRIIIPLVLMATLAACGQGTPDTQSKAPAPVPQKPTAELFVDPLPKQPAKIPHYTQAERITQQRAMEDESRKQFIASGATPAQVAFQDRLVKAMRDLPYEKVNDALLLAECQSLKAKEDEKTKFLNQAARLERIKLNINTLSADLKSCSNSAQAKSA